MRLETFPPTEIAGMPLYAGFPFCLSEIEIGHQSLESVVVSVSKNFFSFLHMPGTISHHKWDPEDVWKVSFLFHSWLFLMLSFMVALEDFNHAVSQWQARRSLSNSFGFGHSFPLVTGTLVESRSFLWPRFFFFFSYCNSNVLSNHVHLGYCHVLYYVVILYLNLMMYDILLSMK